MPHSKRSTPVHLTKTKKKKKDRSAKEELVNRIRGAIDEHEYVYVVEIENEKNIHLQTIRQRLKPGRMFIGKNKVMHVSLGTTPEEEAAENLHQIPKYLKGSRCLIVSDRPPSEMQKLLDEHQPQEFAKSGFTATQTVVLQEGPESLKQFPHSMEHQLRQLGLPTLLKDGVIYLMGETIVCTEDVKLTVEAAQLLKLLGIQMATFRMKVVAVWKKSNSEIQTFILD